MTTYADLLTPAPLFDYGSRPKASEMQEIADTSTALYDTYAGQVGYRWLAQYRAAPGDTYVLQHVHRWLFYRSTGTLEDLNGLYDPVTLDENINGWFGMLDLNTVEWLVPGMVYEVVGVNAAFEDWEPY